MASIWTVFYVIFILTFASVEGARILAYFPTPSISHQVVFRPLVHTLVARGHEVTVVTTDPVYPKNKAPANLTEIDVHDISYELWKVVLANHSGKKEDVLLQIKLIFKTFADIVEAQLHIPELQKILQKDKNYYDLLILEACNRPIMGFMHKFDAPAIAISSFGAVPLQYNLFGAPMHPLLYPTPGRQRSYNLSLLEKGLELFKHFALDFFLISSEEYDYKIMKRFFGEDIPTGDTLLAQLDMLFLNEHPIWADNHPIPPSIKYIGGIHHTNAKELPADLKKHMDSSKHGLIYVSFGTNVKLSVLAPEKIEMMRKVFSELPYDILWKYDNEELDVETKNIKIAKWFPQVDVLNHPNVKLFITQGGLQSSDEAIDATVPVIGIPMLVDQWYNVEKYVHHKIGLQLDIETLTEKSLKDSIETVITDKSFKENIIRLKTLMKENPVKPVDLAVWWAEHLIKYGGEHLKGPAANMTSAEYYEIKLVLVVLSISVVVLVIIGLILRSILRFALNIIYRNHIKIKRH